MYCYKNKLGTYSFHITLIVAGLTCKSKKNIFKIFMQNKYSYEHVKNIPLYDHHKMEYTQFKYIANVQLLMEMVWKEKRSVVRDTFETGCFTDNVHLKLTIYHSFTRNRGPSQYKDVTLSL